MGGACEGGEKKKRRESEVFQDVRVGGISAVL